MGRLTGSTALSCATELTRVCLGQPPKRFHSQLVQQASTAFLPSSPLRRQEQYARARDISSPPRPPRQSHHGSHPTLPTLPTPPRRAMRSVKSPREVVSFHHTCVAGLCLCMCVVTRQGGGFPAMSAACSCTVCTCALHSTVPFVLTCALHSQSWNERWLVALARALLLLVHTRVGPAGRTTDGRSQRPRPTPHRSPSMPTGTCDSPPNPRLLKVLRTCCDFLSSLPFDRSGAPVPRTAQYTCTCICYKPILFCYMSIEACATLSCDMRCRKQRGTCRYVLHSRISPLPRGSTANKDFSKATRSH